MKIAVASMQEEVSQHFGHCEKFKVFTIVDNAVTSVEEIINPAQHSHGQLPAMLMQYGVNIVIAGGIGRSSSSVFIRKTRRCQYGLRSSPWRRS
jgi:predicted Fe-Mo cluster-binding NifX family protein